MLFSVVIPVYNAQENIRECLSSIREQTFHDFEAIVMNDGSKDESAAICKLFCEEDRRFRFMEKRNEGCYLARLDGASSAQGTYLLFVDADDCLDRHTLEKCASVIAEHSPDMVAFLDTYDDRRVFDFNRVGIANGPCEIEGSNGLKTAVCSGKFNSMCAKAIRRDLLDGLKLDRPQPNSIVFAEDLYMLLPIVDRIKTMYFIEEALYFYRQHDGSFSSHYSPSQVNGLSMVMPSFANYAIRWGEDYLPCASSGILRQYCHVAKIIVLSDLTPNESMSAMNDLADSLRTMPEFVLNAIGEERIDNKLLLSSILRGRNGEASLIVKLVETVKRMATRVR